MRKNIRNSQELLVVMRGKVELELGDENIMLSEGDAIHYWSNPAHQKIHGKSAPNSFVIWVGTL